MLAGLSPKLKEWLFPWLIRFALLGLPGLFVLLGLMLGFADRPASGDLAALKIAYGFRQPDGSWTANVYFIAFGVFVWLLVGLLAAQQRRLRQELLEADGEYYMFERQRLRVTFDDDDNLWLYAIDVAAALGKSRQDLPRMLRGFGATEQRLARDKEILLSRTGIERLLEKRSGRDVVRLQRYLLGEVYAVHEKRREMRRLHYRGGRPIIHVEPHKLDP